MAISLTPPAAPSPAEVVATLMECGVLPTTAATCIAAASALALEVDEVTAALDRRGLSALGPPMSYGRLAELALAEVAARSGYSAEDLRGRRRSRDLVRWRHVAYATLRLATAGRASYPELGRVFGRDHTTVMHGVARVGTQPDLALLAEQAAASVRRIAEAGVPAWSATADEHR